MFISQSTTQQSFCLSGTCNIGGHIVKLGDRVSHPDGVNVCTCGAYNHVSNCTDVLPPLKRICGGEQVQQLRHTASQGRRVLPSLLRPHGHHVHRTIKRPPFSIPLLKITQPVIKIPLVRIPPPRLVPVISPGSAVVPTQRLLIPLVPVRVTAPARQPGK